MKILALAPHADDIEIGMGGTLAKFVAEGHNVKIICAIVPCENFEGHSSKKSKEIRKNEAIIASEVIGAELEILDLDPYDFKFDRKYTKLFDKIFRDFGPDELYSCWENDSHQDHKTLSNIAISISRKNDCSYYMYENMIPGGITSEAFNPQLFVDVSEFIDKKMQSIETYESVFRNSDFSEAIRGRANYRGRQIGVKYAWTSSIV